jgi:hypothetical protein
MLSRQLRRTRAEQKSLARSHNHAEVKNEITNDRLATRISTRRSNENWMYGCSMPTCHVWETRCWMSSKESFWTDSSNPMAIYRQLEELNEGTANGSISTC